MEVTPRRPTAQNSTTARPSATPVHPPREVPSPRQLLLRGPVEPERVPRCIAHIPAPRADELNPLRQETRLDWTSPLAWSAPSVYRRKRTVRFPYEETEKDRAAGGRRDLPRQARSRRALRWREASLSFAREPSAMPRLAIGPEGRAYRRGPPVERARAERRSLTAEAALLRHPYPLIASFRMGTRPTRRSASPPRGQPRHRRPSAIGRQLQRFGAIACGCGPWRVALRRRPAIPHAQPRPQQRGPRRSHSAGIP